MVKKVKDKKQMEKTLHFKVDSNLYNDIVRTAYWFEEGRKKWALEVLRCLGGITFKQEHDFLMGNAIFKTAGDCVELIYKEDKKFKQELQDYFFGDGKMKVPECKGEKANFSGWLTKEGFFIRCKGGEHIKLSEIICNKLELLDDAHSNNYERILELNNAIKITSGLILSGDGALGNATGKQVDTLVKYIEDGGHLNRGGYGRNINVDELLDWLGVSDDKKQNKGKNKK